MLAKIFMSLTDYPAIRRRMWKPIYEGLAKYLKIEQWQFMNYGYNPSETEPFLALSNEDEINRYPIQLYHYLASKIDIAGQKILEVGSGRGGGAFYIKKYLKPEMITGLDIAFNAVKLANESFACEGLNYVQGSAEKLPFPDESFDIVINVESSHAYGSASQFLAEVTRVLKPGGYFLCTDMRDEEGMKLLSSKMLFTGMQLIKQEDITQNVSRAIEIEQPIKEKRIEENIPRWFQRIFKEFAGVTGSKIHTDLVSRGLIYHRFVLQKINPTVLEAV